MNARVTFNRKTVTFFSQRNDTTFLFPRFLFFPHDSCTDVFTSHAATALHFVVVDAALIALVVKVEKHDPEKDSMSSKCVGKERMITTIDKQWQTGVNQSDYKLCLQVEEKKYTQIQIIRLELVCRQATRCRHPKKKAKLAADLPFAGSSDISSTTSTCELMVPSQLSSSKHTWSCGRSSWEEERRNYDLRHRSSGRSKHPITRVNDVSREAQICEKTFYAGRRKRCLVVPRSSTTWTTSPN